jgi:hypothetical protein
MLLIRRSNTREFNNDCGTEYRSDDKDNKIWDTSLFHCIDACQSKEWSDCGGVDWLQKSDNFAQGDLSGTCYLIQFKPLKNIKSLYESIDCLKPSSGYVAFKRGYKC